MDIIFTQYPAFLEAKHEGIHNLATDQLLLAFTNVAPNLSHTVLANLTVVDPANLDSVILTSLSSGLSGNDYVMVVQDKVITASGAFGPFQYVHLYNNTATNKNLIAHSDLGAAYTMQSTFQLSFNFDGVNGIVKSTL